MLLVYNDGTDNEYQITRVTEKHVIFNTGAIYPLRKMSDWLHSGKFKIKENGTTDISNTTI